MSGRPAGGAPPDLYALLGAAPDADAEALRAAFRATALRLHPDKAPGPAAAAAYVAAQRAWQVLRDPGARAEYDRDRGLAAGRSHVQVHVHLHVADMEEALDQDGTLLLMHPCRCGDAFTLPLEDVGVEGEEVLVPCASCSLYALVQT